MSAGKDETNDKALVKLLRAKSNNTIAIFAKGDYFTVYGEDAQFVATNIFKSDVCVKMFTLRTNEAQQMKYISVNRGQYEKVVRETIILLRCSVELYANDDGEWTLMKRGSPGNTVEFEQEVGVADQAPIFAIHLGSEENDIIEQNSFIQWNYLPTEIKAMVVERLGRKSRLNLRACSKNEKELVDHVKIREVHEIRLFTDERTFGISLVETEYSQGMCFKFESFDEFQKAVIDQIGKYDFIGSMEIFSKHNPSLTVKLSSTQLVKVRKLNIGVLNVESYLEQVDPSYLKYLELCHSNLPSEVYDIPLVRNVRELCSLENHIIIRNDQLPKMENRIIDFASCENLTFEGVNKFLHNCVENLDEKQVKFEFYLSQSPNSNYDTLLEGLNISSSCADDRFSGEAIIKSKSGKYQLYVGYNRGSVEGWTSVPDDSKKRIDLKDKFTIIDSMRLESSTGFHSLSIRKGDCYNRFYFESLEEFQEKINEEIGGSHYIKELCIYFDEDTSSNLKFRPAKQQITVGKLDIDSGHNLVNIIQQVEPVHLREFGIWGGTDNEEIYDLQQIRDARKVSVNQCRVDDESFGSEYYSP